jgi:hypothetical protein
MNKHPNSLEKRSVIVGPGLFRAPRREEINLFAQHHHRGARKLKPTKKKKERKKA